MVGVYSVGQQAWANDFVVAVENIAGTRVSSLTVQHNSTDASGVDVPLDALWSLPAAFVTINVT